MECYFSTWSNQLGLHLPVEMAGITDTSSTEEATFYTHGTDARALLNHFSSQGL